MYYWVNYGIAGIVIHKETCLRVDILTDNPDWERYDSEREALTAAGPSARKCGRCF